jgi:hypothetical protein
VWEGTHLLYGQALLERTAAYTSGKDTTLYSRIKLVLEPGDLILFQGSLIHAGSRTYPIGIYTRLHFYFEPDNFRFGFDKTKKTNNYFYTSEYCMLEMEQDDYGMC